MESDSDDAGPAKTHAPSTQRGGKVRVEREPAENWPQLVRRCNELNVGARELGLDQSLDEELSVIAASKQHSRYKQKRRKKLRQQVLRAIAAAEVVGLPPLMPHAAASSMPLQPRPVSAVGEAASAMHEAATCGDEPVALRALFVMLAQDGHAMERVYADPSIRSAMAADLGGDEARMARDLRELYDQAGLPMPNFCDTSDGSAASSSSASGAGDASTSGVGIAVAFAPGMHVELHGLVNRPDLNGAHGVLNEHKPNGRWVIQVVGERILVRPQNLRLVHEVRTRRSHILCSCTCLHLHSMCVPACCACTGC